MSDDREKQDAYRQRRVALGLAREKKLGVMYSGKPTPGRGRTYHEVARQESRHE
jgi:hypothetical protein